MFCRVAIILLVSLNIGCFFQRRAAEKPKASQSQVITTRENRKYKLEAIFSGFDFQFGERTEKIIDTLTIRNLVTGQEVKHARSDDPAESLTNAYITDLWSPDEEYLVIPKTQLAFCIIKAAQALEHIQKQTCSDEVSVYVPSGPSLWLTFEKWDGAESFIFKGGVYGDETRLKYEISSGRLTAFDANILRIEGENSKGKIAIGKSH